MDKNAIIRNFSKYARTYDRYAGIQRRLGRDLLGMIRKKDFHKILEIGSGTGNYTLLLMKRFKYAALKAVDISDKMIQAASGKIKDRRVDFLLGDAERLNLDEKFDFITSCACFQWFEDLEKALAGYKGLLKEGGLILFSLFGPRTLWELNASLRQVFEDASIAAGNFTAKEKLQSILSNNFKKSEVKEVIYEESSCCLRDLLSRIKHTGTGGLSTGQKFFWTPRLINKLEEIYLSKFGRIKATYQIFFCRGQN